MPKGWKSQEKPMENPSVVPPLSQLQRPMVDKMSVRIATYKAKIIDVYDLDTGKLESIWNPQADKSIVQFEIQPIEFGHCIIFENPGPAGRQLPSLPLSDISEIKKVSQVKGLFKREDLILEMIFKGRDGHLFRAKINVDDQYADEIIRKIQDFKNLELNNDLWTYRCLKSTTENGQTDYIDIYPLTPFLATGEEILWQGLKANIDDRERKVSWIDIVTNYRVYQYSYEQHNGAVLLFPSVDDVRITNEIRGVGFGQFVGSSGCFNGIQTVGDVGVTGDITFYSQEGTPFITFAQVSDPQTLSTAIKTLNQRRSDIQIITSKTDQLITAMNEADGVENVPSILCSKCQNNNNPAGSKFCNKCGSSLSPICSKCGKSNPLESIFCGQCGFKLRS